MIPYAKPLIGDEEKKKVLEVMDSGMIASGPVTDQFEKEFANFMGCEYGIATSNGTTALHIALLAAGIKPGDKVLTTPFTFIASGNSILYCGAQPVFVDIDPQTFLIDPEKIAEALAKDPEIKALLIVHLYGLSCDMGKIMPLVEKHNLILIEDCAQSHGAEYNGKKTGSFGHAAAFSFYPTKNMTTGEGGMMITNREDIAVKARQLVNHGRSGRYFHDMLGYNYRMTDIAAAIGSVQLKKLADFNAKRRANAEYLSANLAGLSWLVTPYVPQECTHVYHQYTVKVEKRDAFAQWLQEKGVGNSIVYPIPIHKQPFYEEIVDRELSMPIAEEVAQKVISLPIHPALTQEQLEELVGIIQGFSV